VMKVLHRATGEVIFESSHETIKGVEEAASKGISLKEVSLKGADLEGVDLSEAGLRRADLRGADLSTTSLCNAYFGKTRISFRGKVVEVFFREVADGERFI